MDGGAWHATVHGVAKSRTRLSDVTFHFGPSAIRDEPLFSHRVSDSSTLNLANPRFLEMWTFCRPGNLNLALQRASVGCSLFCSLVWTNFMIWSVWTLATVTWGFLKVPHILVWSLSWGQLISHECPLERVVFQGPLGQPVQAAGCLHYQGSCCLQPLHTEPAWGKEL